MRFHELEDHGIPEVQSELEEELSDIDIPTEVKFWNFVFCIGLICGVLLGCWAIIADPAVMETNPEVFLFTLFYISVEVACTIVSVFVFLCFWAVAYLKSKPVMVSDYIGILSVCSFTLSNLAHLLVIPVGCLILARNPVLPIPYKTFIFFQIIFAIFILGKFFFNRNQTVTRAQIHINNPVMIKATAEIENIRSRGNSLHSLQSSFQGGREIRSTSSHEVKKKIEGEGGEEEDEDGAGVEKESRERSVSTGNKLSIKAPKARIDE